jgi:hypothetical protein
MNIKLLWAKLRLELEGVDSARFGEVKWKMEMVGLGLGWRRTQGR